MPAKRGGSPKNIYKGTANQEFKPMGKKGKWNKNKI
jgi:hypothetical protein